MKRIVIIGAGFGGLRTAIRISQSLYQYGLTSKYHLLVIDRNSYHTYTPTLYEVATTAKETANYCDLYSITTISLANLAAQYNFEFLHCAINALDLQRGDVHCGEHSIRFDYLVLAMGAETNYYDIPGLQTYALPFKTFLDAITLRDTVLKRCVDVKEAHIVIGGGGATGVELAGEIQGWLCELSQDQSWSCKTKLSIIDGGATILSAFDSRIIAHAEKRLKKLGIALITDERILCVEPQKVTLQSQRIVPFDLLIWTGGVKAASLMKTLPLLREDRGRITVKNEMECLPQTPDLRLYGKIYGLGDAVCFIDPATQKSVPQLAQAALLQADVVAHNILSDILHDERRSPYFSRETYTPQEYPYILPIGGKYAIAKVGPFVVYGFFGWILKGLVELYYLISLLPIAQALRMWCKGLWIFIRNDRMG